MGRSAEKNWLMHVARAETMAGAMARGQNVLKNVAARKYPIVAVGAVVVFSAPWLFGWPQVVLGVAATDIVLFAMAE
jgi:hypothetical protein